MAFSLAKELSNCCCCCEQLRLMQPTLTKTDDRVGKFSAKIIRKLSVSTRSSNFFCLGGGIRAVPLREKDILFEFMIYEEVVWTRSRRRKRAQKQQHSSKIRVIAAIEIEKKWNNRWTPSFNELCIQQMPFATYADNTFPTFDLSLQWNTFQYQLNLIKE